MHRTSFQVFCTVNLSSSCIFGVERPNGNRDYLAICYLGWVGRLTHAMVIVVTLLKGQFLSEVYEAVNQQLPLLTVNYDMYMCFY